MNVLGCPAVHTMFVRESKSVQVALSLDPAIMNFEGDLRGELGCGVIQYNLNTLATPVRSWTHSPLYCTPLTTVMKGTEAMYEPLTALYASEDELCQ